MTISQARLHLAVEAGRAILDAYEDKCEKARGLATSAKRGDYNPDVILAFLDALAVPEPLGEQRALLAAEAAHYTATARRNERAQTYRRRTEGPAKEPRVAQPAHEPAASDGEVTLIPPPRLTDAERREIAQESELMGLTQTARAMERGGLDPTAGLLPGYEWDEETKTVRRSASASASQQSPADETDDWGT